MPRRHAQRLGGCISSDQRSAPLLGERPRRGKCCAAAPQGRQCYCRHQIRALFLSSPGRSVRLMIGPRGLGARSLSDRQRDLCRGQKSFFGKGGWHQYSYLAFPGD
eukprot:4885957-Pyramimonas_sp.AAC.1